MALAGMHDVAQADTNADKNADRQAPKSSSKKLELAQSALAVLAQLGFARVNLRDIAARSGVSLGVIHYYFHDKSELLITCVGLYKEAFVRQLEDRIASAPDAASLVGAFVEALVQAVREQAETHRLWYDARAQALFDPRFRPIVDTVESRLVDVVRHLFERLRGLTVDPTSDAVPDALAAYVLVDGWFRLALQHHLAGHARAADDLRDRLRLSFDAWPGRPA